VSFFTIVLRGLFRRKVRTLLTLVGIAIGIGAVVALVGISRGFESSWTEGMKTRGTDIVVNSMGSSITPKPFSADAVEKVKQVPGVAAVAGMLVDFMSIESADMMIVSARDWGAFNWANLKIVEGRLPSDGNEPAVILGRNAAEMLKKKVGDPLQLETEELKVVGIFDGGAIVEDNSVVLPLAQFQRITGNEGKVSVIDVRVAPGIGEDELKRIEADINRAVPEARAVAASEHIRDSQAFKMINAMSWATSLLAVLVGVLGVTNTMLMTVFERKQEICILLAIGWRRMRIMRLILWESALLGLFGGIVGVGLGAIGVRLIEDLPTIRGLLRPDVTPELLLTSVAIAVVVGVLSGIYPAWRSSRLSPSEALHV
jgi:putative ABC transport system permease protein